MGHPAAGGGQKQVLRFAQDDNSGMDTSEYGLVFEVLPEGWLGGIYGAIDYS